MSKVAAAHLKAFGRAVREARVLKSWTLDDLATTALGNKNSKGFLSQIEQGKRQLSPLTAGKLVTELGLDKALLKPFLSGPSEDEVTETDHLVEPLLKLAETDPAAAKLAESLLITLAYEFAGGHQGDVASAYANLRGALEASQRLIAQGTMPSNLDAQVQATLAEVSRLVQDNRADEASALVDRELARLADEVAERNQARSQLHQTAIDLARTQNNPKSAADHILAKLKLDTPPDLFQALRAEQDRWFEMGRDQGGAFDLELSIVFGEKLLLETASDLDAAGVMITMGVCFSILGERRSDTSAFRRAIELLSEAIDKIDRTETSAFWARAQNNLGLVFFSLSKEAKCESHLIKAINAFNLALEVQMNEEDLRLWAMTLNNRGSVLRHIGFMTGEIGPISEAIYCHQMALPKISLNKFPRDWAIAQCKLADANTSAAFVSGELEFLLNAEVAYQEASKVWSKEDYPFDWATLQVKLARVDGMHFAITKDRLLIGLAQNRVSDAIEVFRSSHAHAFLEDAIAMLVEIDAA